MALCSVAVAGVLMSPTAASRAKSAVMKAVQMFLGLKALMAPRFRVVRFAYLSDDVDVARDFVDRRHRSADLRMNTTLMVQPASTDLFRAAGRAGFSGRKPVLGGPLFPGRQLGRGQVTG
ncbi:hypothetical protein GCM10010433_36640 [Streptomyces pulveraceus]